METTCDRRLTREEERLLDTPRQKMNASEHQFVRLHRAAMRRLDVSGHVPQFAVPDIRDGTPLRELEGQLGVNGWTQLSARRVSLDRTA